MNGSMMRSCIVGHPQPQPCRASMTAIEKLRALACELAGEAWD